MLHLKTFGGPSVDIGGLPGTGAAQQRKTLALLALLAAAGDRGLSRDKLIAFLWPETDAEHGRRLLKQACYALRRDLHAPELFLGSIHLRLNPAVISSDVGSFAAALEVNDPARAVSSYTAPFLDGFYLNGGGEFETWAETERARLASQCRTALEVLSVAATRRGEHREAAEWWRRLLALDPMSAHAALGLMTALARQYAAAYLRLDPTDVNAPAIRLAALMLDPAQARAPETARVIDSTSAKVLLDAGTAHLGWWADSGETAVRLLREMTTRSGNGALPWTDTLMYRRFLANALAFRGHLHEAYAADRPLLLDPKASPFWNFADPFRALALLGAIPESLGATTYGHALESGTAWYMSRFFTDRQLRGLPWWLARRDTTSLARFALRAEQETRMQGSARGKLQDRYLHAAATAYLALARADSVRALRLFQAIPDTLCIVNDCFYEKLIEARLLTSQGQARQAGAVLDRWVWRGEGPLFVLGRLEQASIAEGLGERDKAMRSYQFVVDVWRRADPELQSFVVVARNGLARLKRE